jgi:soluble lytic murein transglycosylase-like protein
MDASQIIRYEQEDYLPEGAPALPTAAAKPAAVGTLIDQAAHKYGLPPAFVRAVAAAESGYRTDAQSPKGAMGVMQLMPGTARQLGANPADPAQNVNAGTRYLRDLLIKYGSHTYRALAAYNAGPGVVDKYHGVPPYPETQSYILNVLRHWRQEQPAD